jgi:hypothetical protein
MNKVLLVSLICLTATSSSSWQDAVIDDAKNNYHDFSQTKKIKTLGTFKIQVTDIRTIVFDVSEGDISDKNIFDKGDFLVLR